MVDLWWIAGAAAYGFVAGFLTGASKTAGTAKDVVLALVSGGILGTVLTVFKDIDVGGQFLLFFFVAFFIGLLVGKWYQEKHGGFKITR